MIETQAKVNLKRLSNVYESKYIKFIKLNFSLIKFLYIIKMLAIVAGSIMYPELFLRSSISIATNLVTSVNYLITISRSDVELQNMLVLNDIIEDINIIKNFIEEKAHTKHGQTTQVCIENLNKTLIELEKNIKSITDKIENHKNLWFNYMRSYNISQEKIAIPILISQMKHRFEMLIKVTTSLDH